MFHNLVLRPLPIKQKVELGNPGNEAFSSGTIEHLASFPGFPNSQEENAWDRIYIPIAEVHRLHW